MLGGSSTVVCIFVFIVDASDSEGEDKKAHKAMRMDFLLKILPLWFSAGSKS